LLDADVDPAPAIVERHHTHINPQLPAHDTCSIGYAARRLAPGTADIIVQRAPENLQSNRSRALL
jgi:hypothetical protein